MNSRLSGKEERISDLEDRIMEITQSEQWKGKLIFKNDIKLSDLWNNIKHNNIHIIGVPEGDEKKKVIENIFEEIMAKISQTWRRKQISSTGSTEHPKQDEPKQTHTKTYHN